jgi:DNA-binding CsgD family transcriptional regulator
MEMLASLSDREKQVLVLIAEGMTNKEISARLIISESTVENHTHHIYKKLRVSNRAQAVAHVLRLRSIHENEDIENKRNPS